MLKTEFLDNIKTHEGLEKIAKYYSVELSRVLREKSLVYKTLDVCAVKLDELQRTTEHDGLCKMVSIPTGKVGYARHLKELVDTAFVPFHAVSSLDFIVTEDDIINSPKTMDEIVLQTADSMIAIENKAFLDMLEESIAVEGNDKEVLYPITLDEFKDLLKATEGEATGVLINTEVSHLYLSSLNITQFPKRIYPHDMIFGKKLYRIPGLIENKIYAFNVETLGKYFMLNKPKLWVNYKDGQIIFASYMSTGMAILDTKACSSITIK